MENIEPIIECGYTRPLSTISMKECSTLVNCIKKHHCILKTVAEVDQLKYGLSCLGVGRAMELYPEMMKELFVAGGGVCLNAGGNSINKFSLWL